jgi:hypothetical protein
MTMSESMTIDKAELRKLAEAEKEQLKRLMPIGKDPPAGRFESYPGEFDEYFSAKEAFNDAANADAILALLDELEAARAAIAHAEGADKRADVWRNSHYELAEDLKAAYAETARARSEGQIEGMRKAAAMATAAHDRCMNKAGFLRNVYGEWARALTPDAYEKDAGGKANALFNLRAIILAAAAAEEQRLKEMGKQHASDCAVHNAPALPVGPCDCGAAESKLKGTQS